MNKIFLYYQPKLNQLIKALNLIGVELTLVGGAVRDFIGFNKFSSDLDIELTTDINIKSFDLFIDDIIQALNSIGVNSVEKLPYNILRFNYNNFMIELSPGRTEKFVDGDFGHKNFSASYILSKDSERKWKRRDLTINAIGVNLSSGMIIDPFSGRDDIRDKILRHINENFYRDPVRLLRLLRFKLLLGYRMSREIMIENFIMKDLSLFHLFREGDKCGLSAMLNELQKIKLNENVKFSRDYQILMDFSGKRTFINFRQMVFCIAKSRDENLEEFIFEKGLFSRKKYNLLKRFFKQNETVEKRLMADSCRKLGEDFYQWCLNDC